MTNQQGAPEALRLADWLQNAVATYPQVSEDEPGGYCQEVDQVMDEAAAELRRLHAENERLAALVDAQQPAPSAAAAVENLRKALQFYADKEHFNIADEGAWDTVSGEPQNYWCDEEGTATVEDGTIARLALAGHQIKFEADASTQPSPTPQADSQPAPVLDRARIREIFMAHGFTVQEGQTDLKQYVYDAADALLRAARAPADSVTAPAGGANWAQLRSALAMLMLGWGRNPNQTMDACYRVLDSATEPGTALAILRTAPDWRDFMAADRAKVDSVLEDAARYRWLREKPGADLRYGSEQYTRVCAVCQNYGEDLDAAIDAARKQGANHD